MVPDKISVPAEYTTVLIDVHLEIRDGKVVAPGLADLQGALARGSVELVNAYCQLWTRWLAKADQEAAAP